MQTKLTLAPLENLEGNGFYVNIPNITSDVILTADTTLLTRRNNTAVTSEWSTLPMRSTFRPT